MSHGGTVRVERSEIATHQVKDGKGELGRGAGKGSWEGELGRGECKMVNKRIVAKLCKILQLY